MESDDFVGENIIERVGKDLNITSVHMFMIPLQNFYVVHYDLYFVNTFLALK